MTENNGRSRGRRLTEALAVALTLVVGALCFPYGANEASAAAKPATHTVVIDGVKYEPATLTVQQGDTVIWVNRTRFRIPSRYRVRSTRTALPQAAPGGLWPARPAFTTTSARCIRT